MMLFFKKLLLVFKNIWTVLLFLASTVLLYLLMDSFTDFALIAGNLGYVFAYLEVFFNWFIAILFWIFLTWQIYKIILFSEINATNSLWWFLGTFLWVLLSWCPACSISVASYLGLASFFLIFPYYWLEIKIIWIILLAYSIYKLYITIDVCTIKK